MPATRTSPRRRIVLAAALVILLLVAVVTVAVVTREHRDDPLDAAIGLLGRPNKFDSSTEAVVHFADVYQHLVDAAGAFEKDCDVDDGKGRCLAINQAASWSLNFSPASGHCTQPAIQEGRIALLDYLTRSAALDDDATEPPPLPPIPAC
jgi:hypothetical protein